MDYTRTKSGSIQTIIEVDGLAVILQARNVRKQSTGIHANIGVGFLKAGRTIPCDEDTYNISRQPDRERLVRSIYKRPEFAALFDGADYPLSRMSMDLMLFQRGLWEFELGHHEPRKRAGSATREEPRFLIEPWVVHGGGTILFAPPGTGKSWIGQLIAVMVDAGCDRFWNVEQVPTLFVNLERSERSVDLRMGDVNAALGLERERELFRLDKRGASFTDVADAVGRLVEREGIGLVVVDSLSRMGLGKMIDDDVANRGMDALNALKTAWLVLAHTPRADATHTYGSQMFDAAADLTVQLLADEKSKRDTLGLGLKLDKHNDVAPQRDVFQLALEFDSHGLTRLRRALPGEFTIIDAQKPQPSPAEVVRAYVLSVGAVDASTVEEETGVKRSTVATLFSGSGYERAGKEGRRVLYGVSSDGRHDVSPPTVPTLPDDRPSTPRSVVGEGLLYDRHIEEGEDDPF